VLSNCSCVGSGNPSNRCGRSPGKGRNRPSSPRPLASGMPLSSLISCCSSIEYLDRVWEENPLEEPDNPGGSGSSGPGEMSRKEAPEKKAAGKSPRANKKWVSRTEPEASLVTRKSFLKPFLTHKVHIAVDVGEEHGSSPRWRPRPEEWRRVTSCPVFWASTSSAPAPARKRRWPTGPTGQKRFTASWTVWASCPRYRGARPHVISGKIGLRPISGMTSSATCTCAPQEKLFAAPRSGPTVRWSTRFTAWHAKGVLTRARCVRPSGLALRDLWTRNFFPG